MKRFVSAKKLFFMFLAVFIHSVYGEYAPFAGGEMFYDLLSPSASSSGSSLVFADSPLSSLDNPAVNGFLQRLTLEMGYTAINGNNDNKGWGNVFSAGLSAPGRAGVFSSSLFLFQSDFSYLNSSFLAGAGASFSKDIYENLSVGAGLKFGTGTDGSGSDFLFLADLGFLHYPEEFLSERNFRWAAVIKDIGKGFAPDDDYSPFPSTFSPGLGAGMNFYKNEKFEADFTSDILFPAFSNVKIDTAASFVFANSLKLSLAARFDFDRLNDSDPGFHHFNPTIGISYGFRTNLEALNIEALRERDWNRSELITALAVTSLDKDITAIGAGFRLPFGVRDSEGPVIDLKYSEIQHISPDNDGVKDSLSVPVKITDKRFVKGYTFTVYDENSNETRSYLNKEERPENITFRNIVDRLLYVKTGITVPEELGWDGTDNSRSPVPDGKYSFRVEAWDDNGNRSISDTYHVVVDTQAPDLVIEKSLLPDERIFSPNNDGSKDVFTIRQDGSAEKHWKAEIIDSRGSVVKTYDFSGKSPLDIHWDGSGDDGTLLPDGVYTYRIEGEDEAGNRSEGVIENIIISTIETPAATRISDSAFSPNSDNVKDTINFFFDVPVRSGIESWMLDIVSEKTGTTVNTFEGKELLPEYLTFDGKGSAGNVLEEGFYRGKLQVIYKNGNMPEVISPRFLIDITSPEASVSVEYDVFSPNNDGSKDLLVIETRTSSEEFWKGIIADESGKTVREYLWKGNPPQRFTWSGTDSSGRLLPDGRYSFSLAATDSAGNTGRSGKEFFYIDTEETPVILTKNLEAFSPNRDGVKDRIQFFAQTARNEGVERYLFSVHDKNGNTVFVREGSGQVPGSFEWDGTITRGLLSGKVQEGDYSAELDILYINGNNPVSKTSMFNLDITYPEIGVETQYLLFSPDKDGNRDTVDFVFRNTSLEDEWEIIIKDSTGKTVVEQYEKGSPSGFSWDGRDSRGNMMKNGIYELTVQAEDRAGNRTVKKAGGIELDNRPTWAIASVERDGFSPNSDNLFDTVRFDLIHTREVPVESWQLEIIDRNRNSVKTFKDTVNPPSVIIWDGKSGERIAADGSYTALFSVKYKKGDARSSETRSFLLDTSPPKAEVVLSPYPFSPDNDGVEDELDIMISLNDVSGIKEWDFEIFDPYKNRFRKFSGKGTPARKIVWDGYSETGELVQAAEDYPYTLSASDTLGNKVTASGLIAVDVLVVRDGENLKINISSINFAPNSPELVTDIPEIREKNERIIKRLAEILNKYSSYKIRIEGHANNLSWYDPVKAEKEQREELLPLSDARCDTVRSILSEKGVAPERMSKIGMGGAKPIVPFSDTVNRWKNRRVEFILIK